MPYRLKQHESVTVGLMRIACEQITRALSEIDNKDLDMHETVHQVRKRCKKVRAVLRIVRPELGDSYSPENARYREAAGQLSDIRDLQSRVECFDKLIDRFQDQIDTQQFISIRDELRRRRAAVTQADEQFAVFRGEMIEALDAVERWPLKGGGFSLLEGGLAKTYRRGRKAMRAAYEEPSPKNFHEWRKRVKYHWYHMRILRDTWGACVRTRRDQVDQLASLLGDDHDLALLRQTIQDTPREFAKTRVLQVLFGLIDRRRAELEAHARPLGLRVFAEGRKRFLKRMKDYWDAWDVEATMDANVMSDPKAATV